MKGETEIHPEAYDHVAFLQPLAALSMKIGRDLMQVQGPGGNTSLKHEGILWVKASGTELADAGKACIFVPVELGRAHEAVRADDDRPVPVLDIPQAEGMRPSIECSLHALMPHRVVVHNHDVNVIAWAVRRDAGDALAGPMRGLNWAFVPYARPGLPLTRAVRDILDRTTPDVLILGNHGLVAGGETPEEAGRLLEAVRARLELAPRPAAEADCARLSELSDGTRFTPARLPEAHMTALDAVALRIAAEGVLYPDHVVFLGAQIAILPADAPERLRVADARLVAVPGAGVLVEKGASAAAHAMAACLGLVTARLPEHAEIAYLGGEDIAALLGWDAEIYRQKMAQREAEAVQG
jgi:rhamnose utilization protein RhaD (predicted bifunctional aldolase and dehydrogenase)